MIRGDQGVSTVIGAIMILGVLGSAVLYVNTSHVPRQGAALEVQGAEATEAALASAAQALQGSGRTPLLLDIPLEAVRGTPPLLSGIILTPVRAPGGASIEAGPLITLSAILDAPAGGIPPGDPIREDAGGGRMRVYLIGDRSQGLDVGAVVARVGGAYTEAAEYRIEAGMLIMDRGGSSLAIGAPALAVQQKDVTSVSWRIPIIAESSDDLSGGRTAQLGLRPGPESAVGGGKVYSVSLRVETENVAAWSRALGDALGPTSFVNSTLVDGPDNGTVDAIILPPVGTPDATRAVELRVWAIRYEASLALR